MPRIALSLIEADLLIIRMAGFELLPSFWNDGMKTLNFPSFYNDTCWPTDALMHMLEMNARTTST